MHEKNIIKQAAVLLLMVLMVASSSIVVANTQTQTVASVTKDQPEQASRALVWDNVVGVHGSAGGVIVATVRTEGIAFPADDFIFDADTTVDSIFWQGGYFQCQLASGQHDYNWDWRVIFWSDSGSDTPSAEIYNQTIPDANIARQFWYNYTRPENGNTYWVANYSTDLPVPITFDAGVKYWMTVQGIQTPNTYPQACWSRHNDSVGGIKLHQGMILAAYWGYAVWTDLQVLAPDGLPHDLNFQLFGTGAGDTTPPVTTCTITGTNPVIITLSATDDDSGVNHTYYKIDSGTFAIYTGPVSVTDVGDHTVYFYSVDMAGNVETQKSQTFTVEPPPISITIKGGFGIQVVVKNTGTTDLTNLAWTINLDGKLIFVGKAKSGTIASLAAGDEVTLKDFVIGFGKTGIIATVGDAEASASGTVLLFLVIGVK